MAALSSFNRLLKPLALVCLGQLGGALCTAHAQTETGVSVQLQALRVSGFLDGNLLSDEKAVVVHAHAAGNSIASAQLHASFPMPGLGADWRMGAFADAQAWIQSDAVRALAFINNKEKADSNAAYPLHTRYQIARRKGLSLAKTTTLDLPQFAAARVFTRARIFAVDQFKAGQADGTLTESASGQLGLQANIDQYQLGGTSPFISPAKTLGWGGTVDIGLRVDGQGGHYGSISVADIGPATRLPSVLRTDRKANTNNVSYDANGYAQYAPLITGQYSPASYAMRYAPTYAAEGGWALAPQAMLIAKLESTAAVHQLSVGGLYKINQQSLQGMVYTGKGVPSSLGLAWRFKYGEIGWRGDRLSLSRARVWGLTAGLRF
jgi:hypothetical protein